MIISVSALSEIGFIKDGSIRICYTIKQFLPQKLSYDKQEKNFKLFCFNVC
jgi:hypothetical protein